MVRGLGFRVLFRGSRVWSFSVDIGVGVRGYFQGGLREALVHVNLLGVRP